MKKKINKKIANSKKLKLILIIMLLILATTVVIPNYYLNKINYVEDDIAYENPELTGNGLFDDDEVFNLIITGSDSRAGDVDGNTDTIIVLSINKQSQKIVMTSIMRDLQVQIPGHGTTKINAAVPYGGHTLLLDTLYKNFGIKSEKYVAIDFFSFIKIVDAIGGVEIDVANNEIYQCNLGISNINTLTGIDRNDGLVTEAGIQTLSGKQALAYARIRYVGNADYERTSRQREVLTQIMNKIQQLDFIDMLNLVSVVLPEISTNLSKNEITSLATLIVEVKDYDIIENRIPAEGESVQITNYDNDIKAFNTIVYGN